MRLFKKIFNNKHSRPGLSTSLIQDQSVRVSDDCPILYGLNSPQYHLLRFSENNLFSGWILSLGSKMVRELAVSSNGNLIGSFPVNNLRDDISRALPQIPIAKRCGFDFELHVGSADRDLIFDMIFDDGSKEYFLKYDLSYIRRRRHKIMEMKHIVDDVSLPDGALVYLTQGHRDVKAYADSIIPFILNVRRYLEHCGIDIDGLRTILDFGCGSGRALVGWFADDPVRNLLGCDINDELVSWTKKNMPSSIRIDKTLLKPPLPYAAGSFDIIQLVSVFTHLALDTQKLWIQEFQRILKPGGYILVTLHGRLYVRLSGMGTDDFDRLGYCEISGSNEGANDFGTFHSLPFVKSLFESFEILGYFPAGMIGGERLLFQIASQQDVYLLRYKG
jgi:SAM-dependent methyltransferase